MAKRKGTSLLVAVVVIIAGILAVTFVLPRWMPRFFRVEPHILWETPYFHLGGVPVNLELITETLVFLALLTLLTRFARGFLRRNILTHLDLDEGQRYAIELTVSYSFFALGLLVGLQIIGLNLNSLAFLGGALGIGIGFGLQNLASNFASGLILLFERSIKIGDRVEVGGLIGDVMRIGARSTWVRTNDNLIIVVPNADFTSNRVTNWTANDRRVRLTFPIGVAYGTDVEKVRSVLLEIARQHPDIMGEPPSEVLLSSFGDSSINFDLRVWTVNQVETPNRLKSDLYFEIVRQFAANGIEIPFPQRDVHIRSVAASAPPGGATHL